MLLVKKLGKHYTVKEVSEMTGIYFQTIAQMIKAGKIKYIQDTIGHKTKYIHEDDLEILSRPKEKKNGCFNE